MNCGPNKQIIRNWQFWAGVACGVVITLLVLSMIGRLQLEAPHQEGPPSVTVLDSRQDSRPTAAPARYESS